MVFLRRFGKKINILRGKYPYVPMVVKFDCQHLSEKPINLINLTRYRADLDKYQYVVGRGLDVFT